MWKLAELTMYETLIRPHEVHQVPKLVSIETVMGQVKAHELKKEQRRLQQVAASDKKRNSRKRKREDEEEGGPDLDLGTGDQKRRRDVVAAAPHPSTTAATTTAVTSAPETKSQDSSTIVSTALGPPPQQQTVSRQDARLASLATSTPMAKPMPEVRGHTSYLTFATLLPITNQPTDAKGAKLIDTIDTDTSWEAMETTTAFDQLIASIPESVGFVRFILTSLFSLNRAQLAGTRPCIRWRG
jgi:tRNA (adenine57-N1/adenine58-N1)-methyltransferase